MPEAVVDDLEAVEVKEMEGQHAPSAPRLVQATGQEVLEDDSVGQAGQGIVMRQVLDPQLRLLPRRDVLLDRDEVSDLAIAGRAAAG